MMIMDGHNQPKDITILHFKQPVMVATYMQQSNCTPVSHVRRQYSPMTEFHIFFLSTSEKSAKFTYSGM